MSLDLDVAKQVEKIEHIGGMAVGEIQERLKNDPQDFNSATLVRLATEATKIGLMYDRRSTAPALRPEVRLLQFVASEGLPRERQIELLTEGVKRMESHGLDASELQSALTNLVSANGASKLLAIEGGSK